MRVPRHFAEQSRGRSGFAGSAHTSWSPTTREMWSGTSMASPTRAGGWRSAGGRHGRSVPQKGLKAGWRCQPATAHGSTSLLLGAVPQCQLTRLSAAVDGGASACMCAISGLSTAVEQCDGVGVCQQAKHAARRTWPTGMMPHPTSSGAGIPVAAVKHNCQTPSPPARSDQKSVYTAAARTRDGLLGEELPAELERTLARRAEGGTAFTQVMRRIGCLSRIRHVATNTIHACMLEPRKQFAHTQRTEQQWCAGSDGRMGGGARLVRCLRGRRRGSEPGSLGTFRPPGRRSRRPLQTAAASWPAAGAAAAAGGRAPGRGAARGAPASVRDSALASPCALATRGPHAGPGTALPLAAPSTLAETPGTCRVAALRAPHG